MGLENGQCDSCNCKPDVLVPLAILNELPSGGTKMVVRYYCKTCAEIILEESNNEDELPKDKYWIDTCTYYTTYKLL